MEGHDSISTDDIEYRLLAAERLIAQLRSEQAGLVIELDRRQVPLADGCRSLTEWLAGRLDVSRRNASALVNVGRRLVDQPALRKHLATGKVSFDRAEALGRFGGDPDEFAHLGLAALHQIASTTHTTSASEQDVFDGRELYLQPTLDHSRWKLWGHLPGVDGTIIQDALFAKADTFPHEAQATSRATRHADALTAICLDSLTGGSTEHTGTSNVGITVFVDTRLGPNGYLPAGPAVGPNTLAEILCTGTIETNAITADGTPLGVGRRTGKIPPRLRRFVLGRDRGCTAAGCTSRYRLQPHHKQHWADGGATDADNLITLCWYHHHVIVHQRGYTIDPDSPIGQTRFLRPQPRAPNQS